MASREGWGSKRVNWETGDGRGREGRPWGCLFPRNSREDGGTLESFKQRNSMIQLLF